MEIKDYIEEIHASDAYGVIVETGCGNAVSSALLNVPGASKTVHETYVPYNFDVTKQYLKHDCRAVSRTTVVDLRNSVLDGNLLNYNKFTHKCNLIYTASFQIGDNDSTTISHGYISIKYKGDGAIYHLTFPMGLSREYYIKLISDIGIKLIHCTIKKVFDNLTIPDIISDYGETYIDIMEDLNREEKYTICIGRSYNRRKIQLDIKHSTRELHKSNR